MTVIDRINAEYPRMTKSEKALSAYLLSYPDEFERASIQQLAAQNGLSTTTLIRFARRLGYDGFRELKRALCDHSAVYPTLVNKFESVASLSGNTLLSNTISRGLKCIEDTFSRLSAETIDHTIALLTEARRVYTFGMKESYALAHYAYTRFYTVRDNVFLLNVSNDDFEPMLDLGKNDVCIVFLFHRYTKRALDVLKLLKQQNVSVVIVTNEPTGEVEQYADMCISCTVDGIGVKNTSLAPVCLLDFFCNALAAAGSQKTLDRFKHIEQILETQAALGN